MMICLADIIQGLPGPISIPARVCVGETGGGGSGEFDKITFFIKLISVC